MSVGPCRLRFSLRVGSLESEAFVLVAFTLNEQLSKSFMLELEVASDNAQVEPVMEFKE